MKKPNKINKNTTNNKYKSTTTSTYKVKTQGIR